MTRKQRFRSSTTRISKVVRCLSRERKRRSRVVTVKNVLLVARAAKVADASDAAAKEGIVLHAVTEDPAEIVSVGVAVVLLRIVLKNRLTRCGRRRSRWSPAPSSS